MGVKNADGEIVRRPHRVFALDTRTNEIARTKQRSANFADYLIGAINYEHKYIHTVTFDRKLKTAKRFKVLD